MRVTQIGTDRCRLKGVCDRASVAHGLLMGVAVGLDLGCFAFDSNLDVLVLLMTTTLDYHVIRTFLNRFVATFVHSTGCCSRILHCDHMCLLVPCVQSAHRLGVIRNLLSLWCGKVCHLHFCWLHYNWLLSCSRSLLRSLSLLLLRVCRWNLSRWSVAFIRADRLICL